MDVGFAQDMSVHHLRAIRMATIAGQRSDDAEVRQIAFDVESNQLEQVGRMKGWLGLWDRAEQADFDEVMAWMGDGAVEGGHAAMAGHSAVPAERAQDGATMPGMATSAEIDRLR